MEPSHIHTVTADSDPGMRVQCLWQWNILHTQFQKLHKQPQRPTLKMKIFKRGRTNAKIAVKWFLYKRLKPSLEGFEREGHKRDRKKKTISLVGKYAKTSALSAVHRLVMLSGSLNEKKVRRNKTQRHPENNVCIYFHGWSCQEFECKVPAVLVLMLSVFCSVGVLMPLWATEQTQPKAHTDSRAGRHCMTACYCTIYGGKGK